MRGAVLLLSMAVSAGLIQGASGAEVTITLLALSDYHSHALPFDSEGRRDQGGLARALAYLRRARAASPAVLVVSGGDTLNAGSPTWSDEYRCVEWPWFEGLVDVMALGNHDLDYGAAELDRCRSAVRYPVLSANLLDGAGRAILTAGGKSYLVREVGGVKIGFFAVAGPDFPRLVAPEHMPPGSTWGDPVQAARGVVEALRQGEGVQAVVLIGHEHTRDDEALAKAVPGIDLVLGTHSHEKIELREIPGTRTRILSPYQYLAYLSEVRLQFQGGRLAGITGGLVPMDAAQPEDPEIARRVADLEARLEARHPERFRPLGRTQGLPDAGVSSGECALGNWATGALRRAAGTHAFFATASTFRGGLPAGPVTLEALYQAIPYDNRIVTAELTGRQLRDWVAVSVSQSGSGGFSQQSGVRYRVREGRPAALEVLLDPRGSGAQFRPVEDDALYQVGTTDYQAFVAPGYRDLFAAARNPLRTGLEVHGVLVAELKARPAVGRLDGRSGAGP